jgi:hypothetical protein
MMIAVIFMQHTGIGQERTPLSLVGRSHDSDMEESHYEYQKRSRH